MAAERASGGYGRRNRSESRILIDALAARFGGTVRATVDLARHLSARPEIGAVLVITRSGSLVERSLLNQRDVGCVTLPAARRGELFRRTTWEMMRMPAIARRERCDVIISMSGILPKRPGYRTICLLGNQLMYETDTLPNRIRREAVRRSVRRAAYVAAPSQAMAEMVSASTGRQCSVARWGVDHHAFSPAENPGEEILCVADFKAYKRHDLVLEAWLRLATPRPVLRFVGNPDADRQAHARLLARIDTLASFGSIRMDYRVPHEQMPALYRRARVFALASEHESFCMPLAESMACGVPAVVRGLPSLRETGGDGATYLEVDDPAVWANAISALVESDARHQSTRLAGIRAAERFSWDGFAENIAAQL